MATVSGDNVQEPTAVSVEDAMERLAVIPDYDPGDGPKACVHTFAQGVGGMLLGAHWSVEQAREFMERYGVEESGPAATGTGHGLVVIGDDRVIFFETKPEAVAS